ncbi:MAG TPA: SAVED domain-containing protein [Longimicrobiaceae bacterium]|nr:SAVED domain-containing protein [Longimicrobiaceae bacterium]
MTNMARSVKPSVGVQNELWARAAGRCEFRGCNELVYVDSLTQKRSNLSAISHIVAYSPGGPRGDPVRSAQLAKDITNLMLTCRKHGKIIDDHDKVDEYPEELLLEFKREHEERIRMLTGIKEEAQTHVLLVQAPIDGCDFAIDETRAFQAILPKYPAEESAYLIDLCGIPVPATTEGFFPLMAQTLTEQVRALLRRRAGKPRIRTLSVFALAPVPLLVHLGREIGDIQQVDLYQKHRRGGGWTWKQEETAEEFYEATRPETLEGDGPIALVLGISDSVSRRQVEAALGEPPLWYGIRASEPGLDFLVSRKRLEVFGYELRKLLADLREAHGQDRPVHVFAAVPSPVAIELGRNIRDLDPEFVVHEYDKKHRRYLPALTVNSRKEQ